MARPLAAASAAAAGGDSLRGAGDRCDGRGVDARGGAERDALRPLPRWPSRERLRSPFGGGPLVGIEPSSSSSTTATRRARTQRRRDQKFRIDGGGRNLLADVGLDIGQTLRIHVAGKADRIAVGAQTRGAADAVHVIFGVLRQVVVEDVADILDVQAARGDVGRNQDFDFAALEFAEQALALLLRHVAGEHADEETLPFQTARDFFRGDFHVDEDDAAMRIHPRQQTDQQRQFFFRRREIDDLAHAVGGDVVRFDGELGRVVHVLVGEFEHAMAQRRREHQALAALALGQAAEQEAHVLDEAQIEHAVGFVDHHHFDGAEREHVLLEVVDQAAGRGDDDVDAVAQLLALLVVIDAAVDQRRFQAGVAADVPEVLVDLDRQFARRRDDQRARIVRRALGQRRLRQQAIHHRDEERAGLAGAGLRLAGDVAALQRERQRQRLDRRAARESGRVQAGKHVRMQIEGFEKGIGEGLLMH